jgi:hypothetical protein
LGVGYTTEGFAPQKKNIVANSKELKTGCILVQPSTEGYGSKGLFAAGGDDTKFKIQWLACPTLKILDYSHGEQNIK